MNMLKDEYAVREYLIERIEGVTGIYDNWCTFQTVNLIKIALHIHAI